MADISAITLPNNTTLNLKDAEARNQIEARTSKIVSISLSASWNGNDPYTQVVTVPGSTVYSKVDLLPDASVLSQLFDDGVMALYIVNNNGTFTAYALGAHPTIAMTLSACVTYTGTYS